jgi:hypothetical protein
MNAENESGKQLAEPTSQAGSQASRVLVTRPPR